MLIFDWMSLFFIATVSIISARVLFYSSSYIAGDYFLSRFIRLVILFVIRIWILILRPNFIRILLGWDGLGVTSYLLVIYFQRSKSYGAGILTALTNRLGDVGLLLTIGLTTNLGRWSFYYYTRRSIITLPPYLLFLLIITASTKRAQLPFSSWLPAAMAAPTPVSSLVHSSTLVTAGVYLLIRINFFLMSIPLSWCLAGLGLFTIFIAGIRAVGELDIKKVVALSTLRQLGLIFITLGLGLPTLAFFHLVAHAYFKAILFITAGAIIHTFKDFQDLRALGSGLSSLPFSLGIFLTANLRLCGIPFMSGFFSKDLILEIIMIGGINVFIFLIAMVSTALTVIYTVRLTMYIFRGSLNSEPIFSLLEIDKTIKIRILILLLLSCVGGLGISWSLDSSSNLIFLPFWIKTLILFIIILRPISWKLLSQTKQKVFVRFFHYMWFIPYLFGPRFSKHGLVSGGQVFKLGETGWLWISQVKILVNLNRIVGEYSLFSFKRIFLKRLSIVLIFILLTI